MIDQIAIIAKDIAILLGISLVAGLVLSPLVFAMTFMYDWFCNKYKNIAPILVIVMCTIIGTFVGLLLVYTYIKITVRVPIV